jgi:hypothetical protein
MSSPATDDAASAYLGQINALAAQVLTATDPYEVGVKLWGTSGHALLTELLAGSLWRLWGSLTDWVELKPAEADLAKTEMVRAAREWLTLNLNDGDAVGRYFDYWLYDVCGYERP